METSFETEICVIGGGPAGSIIARQLALMGHFVCLIEQSAFPRPHLGESLPPGILPLLDFLNLRERIEEASFLRSKQVIVHWSKPSAYNVFTGESGFQVDRGVFDQILLDAAGEAGVVVLQPARAMRPRLGMSQGRKRWCVAVEYEGSWSQINATYIVAATGRQPLFSGKRKRCAQPTIALYGYWKETSIDGEEIRLEAGNNEWFWGASLPDGLFNAMVFVDTDRCRSNGVKRKDWQAFYRSLLAESNLLRGCLEGKLVSEVKICDASTYMAECPVDEHSIMVGDACFAIDPLSSQGVQAAINSALQGSIVVHTILSRPENSNAAIEFYHSRQREAVERHCDLAAQYYEEASVLQQTPFWQKRAATKDRSDSPIRLRRNTILRPDQRLALSHLLSIITVPCIKDSVISYMRALKHPGLARPVAYFDGIEVAPLLEEFSHGSTVAEVIKQWPPDIPLESRVKIMHWMCDSGLLVH